MNSAAVLQDIFAMAISRHQAGDLSAARSGYTQVLQAQPNHFDALHLSGVIAQQQGDAEQSVRLIDRALQIGPATAAAHSNLGNAHLALNNLPQALQHYELAVSLDAGFAQAHFNLGNVLTTLGELPQALDAYAAATRCQPDNPLAWLNLANTHFLMQQLLQALPCYRRALVLQPDNAATQRNLATTLLALGDYAAAVTHFDAALQLQPDTPECHYNRAAALTQMRDFAAAAEGYAHALRLRPDYPLAPGMSQHMRMRLCDWAGFDTAVQQIAAQMAAGQLVTPTFPALALFDDPSLHRQAAHRYSQILPDSSGLALLHWRSRSEGKLRIGYFSAEFHEHAVANQMVDLYGLHDRSRFEIFAFSLAPPKHDAMRQQLQASFDGFFDVHTASDREVVDLARQQQLDIAVDLNGYSGRGRPAIFAMRCARTSRSPMAMWRRKNRCPARSIRGCWRRASGNCVRKF